MPTPSDRIRHVIETECPEESPENVLVLIAVERFQKLLDFIPLTHHRRFLRIVQVLTDEILKVLAKTDAEIAATPKN